MNDFNYLTADDFDDVRGIDPWAPAPKPAVVAPVLAPAQHRRYVARSADRNALMSCDPEFLALVDPFTHAMREQLLVQLCQAFTKGGTQTAATGVI